MELVRHSVLSPAKINLMLRVLSQRDDGYHELQTCFQILDWGDQLGFEPLKQHGDNVVSIEGVTGVAEQDNLITQATELLRPLANNTSDWLVQVKKNIPMGSGLGGGSSNAAETLKFFNEVWQCGLSTTELLGMGKKLGADVPVFIQGQACLATGVGDEMTPMEFDTPYVLLMFPGCHINTAALFKDEGLTRNQAPIQHSAIHMPGFWINDFFPLVLEKYQAVKAVFEAVRNSMAVRLSGSGSTLFAVFQSSVEAQKAYQYAKTVCASRLVRPRI